MSTSGTLLNRIDSIQNIDAKLCCELFVSLQHHHYAAAFQLLLKLLDGHYCELLQTIFSYFTSLYIAQKKNRFPARLYLISCLHGNLRIHGTLNCEITHVTSHSGMDSLP